MIIDVYHWHDDLIDLALIIRYCPNIQNWSVVSIDQIDYIYLNLQVGLSQTHMHLHNKEKADSLIFIS